MGGGGTSLKEGEVLYTRYKSGNNVFSLSGVIFKETPTSNRMRIYFEEGDEDNVSIIMSSIEVQPLVVKVNAIKANNFQTLKPDFITGGVSSYLKPQLSTNANNVFLLIGFLVDSSYLGSSFNTTVHTSSTTVQLSEFDEPMPLINGTTLTYRQDFGNTIYTLEQKNYRGSVLLTKNKNNIHFMNPFEVYNADGTLKNFLFSDKHTPYFLRQTKTAKVVNAPIMSLTVSN